MTDRDRSDEEIDRWLVAAKRGEEPGFTGLYRCLAGRVAGYLRARGVAEADDVVNQVFVGAFRNLAAFEGGATEFRSWLFSIAWNKSCDWHRRRTGAGEVVAVDLSEAADVHGGDVEDEALAGMTDDVDALLAVLTDDQRDVLLLRLVAGLSLEETAHAVDKPVGAVKALQHRALAALRKNLAEAVSDDPGPAITELR